MLKRYKARRAKRKEIKQAQGAYDLLLEIIGSPVYISTNERLLDAMEELEYRVKVLEVHLCKL